MDILEGIMNVIAYSGEAKSFAFKAIQSAREKDFTAAEEALAECERILSTAHKNNSDLLFYEAQGNDVKISLLMIHAFDHFSNAETVKEFAQEIVLLYKDR